MTDPMGWIESELERLRDLGLRRERRVITPLAGGRCAIAGRELLNFAGNDYLGLATDQRVTESAKRALCNPVLGAGASALVCGRTQWHAELERTLARFECQPAAILFPTGFAANVGTIGALAGEGDTVYCDRLNHASLVDGCRLSSARIRIYRHDRLERLQKELAEKSGGSRRLIVTDGVFSMDGDLAPLPELCHLAERFGAMLLVDEAHGTGVFGESGRGTCEHFGVEDRVAVRVGTLSKAIGALGGFVAGPERLIDWLWNRARTQIYSTALPPAICAGATRAVELISEEPARRDRLREHSALLRRQLAAVGVEVSPGVFGPIVPIVLNSPEAALAAASRLESVGILVGAIRPPTVPRGTSRLRVTLSAAHSPEDVESLAGQIARAISG